MVEEIFEVKIVNINQIPPQAQEDVTKQVAKRPIEFRNNFRGFAKIVYVTASPKRITSIEPIEGTIVDYFKSIKTDGINFAVF